MKLKMVCMLLSLGLLTGCGYTTQNMLPPDVKTIHIPIFKNKTFKLEKIGRSFKREIEKKITDDVVEEFLEDASLRVVSDRGADWLLEGKVTQYETEPLRYSRSNSDIVEEYRVKITVELKLTDIQQNKVLWDKEVITQTKEFYVSGTILDEEESALLQASERIAKDIFIQVMEGWY